MDKKVYNGSQTAKILIQKHNIDTGRNRLYEFLIEQGVLSDKNIPKSEFIEKGYLEIGSTQRETGLYKMPFFTEEGIEFVARLYKKRMKKRN